MTKVQAHRVNRTLMMLYEGPAIQLVIVKVLSESLTPGTDLHMHMVVHACTHVNIHTHVNTHTWTHTH